MVAYTVTRSIDISAEPSRCHGMVDDFRTWPAWSPWEDADPDLQRTYSGADRGAGARYAWSGNRKAGRGSMEIVRSTPETVEVHLVFEKPWRAENPVAFTFDPVPTGTRVTWTMSGESTGVAGLFARLVPMEKLLGKDFDRGLARLKTACES